MSKLFIIVFVLLCLTSYSYNPLKIRYGNTHAKMMNGYGQVYIPCNGAVGGVRYHYGGLPSNWRQQENYIMIPNIVFFSGEYIVRVRVQDQDNHVLQEPLKLAIEGLNINVKKPGYPETEEKSIAEQDQEKPKQQEQKEQVQVNPYEAQKNAAIARQNQASSTIANLISLIQKANHQIKKGQGFAAMYQQEKNKAEKLFEQCSSEELALNDAKENLSAELKQNQDNLETYKEKQNQLQSSKENQQRIKGLIAQNQAFENQKPITEAQIKAQQEAFNSCQVIHQGFHDQYDELNVKIPETQSNIENYNEKAAQSEIKIEELSNKIAEEEDIIENLKKSLAEAEARKDNHQQQKGEEQKNLAKINVKVEQLGSELTKLSQRISEVGDGISIYHSKCGKMEDDLSTAKNKLREAEKAFEERLKQIETLNALIKQNLAEIQKLKQKVVELEKKIANLEGQIHDLEKEINNQQKQCDKLQEQLQKILNQLNSIWEKIKEQQDKVEELTAKLEKARAEKELADLKVEEITKKIADVKQYPEVAEAEQKSEEEQEEQQKPQPTIEGLNNLLYPKSQLQVLAEKKSYPFSPLTNRLLNGTRQIRTHPEFTCNEKGNRMKGSGVVISLNPGVITIRNSDGSKMNLEVAPCSNMKSTEENHVLNKDDNVNYEVNVNEYGVYELQILVCYV